MKKVFFVALLITICHLTGNFGNFLSTAIKPVCDGTFCKHSGKLYSTSLLGKYEIPAESFNENQTCPDLRLNLNLLISGKKSHENFIMEISVDNKSQKS